MHEDMYFCVRCTKFLWDSQRNPCPPKVEKNVNLGIKFWAIKSTDILPENFSYVINYRHYFAHVSSFTTNVEDLCLPSFDDTLTCHNENWHLYVSTLGSNMLSFGSLDSDFFCSLLARKFLRQLRKTKKDCNL